MGKSTLEERGRIIIPKDIRDELNLKPGQEIVFEKTGAGIIIRPAIDRKTFTEEMCGCVKNPKIRPKDVKNIWHM